MIAAAAAAIVFATPRGVYAASAAGARVRRVSPALPRDTYVDDVASLGRHIWFVGWNVDNVRARLYRSSDDGRTWRNVAVPSHSAHAGARDAIQFLDARRGWLTVEEPTASFATLFTTRDGGATWHDVGGLPEIAAPHFLTARRGYLAGSAWSSKLYWTQDGGRHWRVVHVPPVARGAPVYGTPAYVAGETFEPVTFPHAFVVYRGTPALRASSPLPIAFPPKASCVADPLMLAVATKATWWTATRDTVYRTRDAGRHWQRFAAPAAAARCETPRIRAVDGFVVYSTYPAGSFVSRDGEHWRPLR